MGRKEKGRNGKRKEKERIGEEGRLDGQKLPCHFWQDNV